MPGGQKSDDVRLQAVTMIAAGTSYGEIEAQLGVSRRTLSRWLKEDDFREALADLRSLAVEKVTDKLAGHLDAAVETLVRAMSSKVVHAEVRAAVELVNLYFKANEMGELRGRLADLEQRFKEQEEEETFR
jgi:hypothetical protein